MTVKYNVPLPTGTIATRTSRRHTLAEGGHYTVISLREDGGICGWHYTMRAAQNHRDYACRRPSSFVNILPEHMAGDAAPKHLTKEVGA
jgi:hypothetical protein